MHGCSRSGLQQVQVQGCSRSGCPVWCPVVSIILELQTPGSWACEPSASWCFIEPSTGWCAVQFTPSASCSVDQSCHGCGWVGGYRDHRQNRESCGPMAGNIFHTWMITLTGIFKHITHKLILTTKLCNCITRGLCITTGT